MNARCKSIKTGLWPLDLRYSNLLVIVTRNFSHPGISKLAKGNTFIYTAREMDNS